MKSTPDTLVGETTLRPAEAHGAAVRRARGWVGLWMVLIFVGSTGWFSDDNTSRFLAPLLRWLFPGITEPTIQTVRLLICKGAHLAEYAMLAGLMWRALRLSRPGWWQRAPQSVMATTLAACALYAASDEWHQSFVASRMGSPWDVLLDTAGAALGLAAAAGWQRWRGRNQRSPGWPARPSAGGGAQSPTSSGRTSRHSS